MADSPRSDASVSAPRRWWRALWRPSVRWSVGSLLAIGVIAGILFWGAFHTAMEATNTLAFDYDLGGRIQADYQTWNGSAVVPANGTLEPVA